MVQIASLSQLPSVEQLVRTFSARERKPLESLERKKNVLSNKSSILSKIKSNLSTLRTRVKGFSDIGSAAKLKAKTAVSSDESFFKVTADSNASTGVNTLFVSRIAKNDLAVSSVFDETATGIASTFDGTTQSFTIQVGSASAITVSVSFSNASESNEDVLGRIADAINVAVEDVNATSISSTKDDKRLSIVSDESGSENTIALADDSGSSLLEELDFITNANVTRRNASKTQGGFIETDTDDLDAVFEINGIEIVSSSNSVTGVIKGVTIELRKAQSSGDDPETFTISNDSAEIREQIDEFIKEYNAALEFISEKVGVNASTNERGELAGNFTFLKLKINLRSIISGSVDSVTSGNPELLSQIGITPNSDGTLKIDDEDALEDAITDSAQAVIDLFTSSDGVATLLTDLIEGFTLAGTTIDKNISIINEQKQTIDRQIGRFETSFKFREASLRQQFTQLERTLALLNSQQASLQRLGFSPNSLFQFNSLNSSNQNQSGLF